MVRAQITRIGELSGETARDEAATDVKPLPWLHCALLMLLASALCYGIGYFAIAALITGRF